MNRSNFLELLSSATPHQINKMIEDKGKQPKKLKIVFVLK